jgi:hypothetical protein
MQPTRITVFVVFHVCSVVAAIVACATFARAQFGLAGMLAAIIIGFLIGHLLGALPSFLVTRWMFRSVQRSSSARLWTELSNVMEWNFYHTAVLLQLAARGEQVERELPRILCMLESDSALTRVYGWDALRLVFTDHSQTLAGFDPGATAEECRQKITSLRNSTQR